MANFSGQPSPVNRFLGAFDADDATNTPIGLAAIVRNCRFETTSVRTRDGFNTTMTGVNKAPITGILGMLYTPETATDTFFQLPTIFDFQGALQYESPVGTGRMVKVGYKLFTPPAASHMIGTQTANLGFMAFSNLESPTSQMAVFNPKTLNLDPYGMKPYGWNWLPSTAILANEVGCPSTANSPSGNGHTYQCIQAGTTGAVEPTWPTATGAKVNDGTVIWQEHTAVMANRIAPPNAPALTRDPGAGTFAAGRDIYIMLTFLNAQGETIPSSTSVLSDTNANDAVEVAIPTRASLPSWVQTLASQYAVTGCNVYECDVATGSLAPPETSYQKVGQYALGATALVTTSAESGIYPPTLNSARITPGQIPTPDVEPTIERVSSGGSFPVGRDVYVLMTYVNDLGETPAGPVGSIVDTELDDGVEITLAAPTDYPQVIQVGVYECDVPTGNPAPNSTQFALVGYYASGATPTITESASGPPPPTSNGTGPGGNIAADSSTGGLNGTQGYRYAAVMWMNRNYTVSGFTASSVIQYIVDEDGWELCIFNVPTGPANIVARICAFTVADGTNAGDFFWIGNYNPQIPSASVVYPSAYTSDQVSMTATIFADNVTTSGTFNFTDTYLLASNVVTDRLQVIWPYPAVHTRYCPSVDRIFCTGVPGYYSGCWVSLAADYESYYASTSFIAAGSDDGERAWGVIEYRNVIYLMRERSAMILSPSTSSPNAWSANKRWSEVGACGPRAFDSCGAFMIFVHRSGIYRYVDIAPDLMTKEIPFFWESVNWSAAETICCTIDQETHEVHILVPVGQSTVPNVEVCLNYLEGWQNPIHYSTFTSKEISMDAARKYSYNDIAAFLCCRIERTLPAPPAYPSGGFDGLPVTGAAFYTSQFVYGSSGYDGTVQASTPGIFSDNGAGIDCWYETVCPQMTLALCKMEGFSLNARGNGQVNPYALAGRASLLSAGQSGPLNKGVLRARPIDLTVNEMQGISRMFPSKLNERWRMHFDNGKVAGNWFWLKSMQLYTIPMYAARAESQQGG